MSEYIVEVNDSPTITLDGWNVRCDDMFIQREEIVRCRDCTRYEAESSGDIGTCSLGLEDTGLYSIVEPDGFCAWGVRRNDGRNDV